MLSTYCEALCVIYMELSGSKVSLGLLDSFLCSLCCNLLVELCKLYRACVYSTAPVCCKALALGNCLDDHLVVWSPVDLGRDKSCVWSQVDCAYVVSYVWNSFLLTCLRSSLGVSVLADEDTSVVDQGLGTCLLLCDIKPGVGVCHFHCSGGAYMACSQEE